MITAAIIDEELVLEEATGLPIPQQIIYNYDGMGYRIFPQQESVLQSIAQIPDAVARGYSYLNTHENLLNACLDPMSVFELYKEGLTTEENALILRRISGQTQNLF